MQNEPTSFDEYVIRGIIANNQFGITSVIGIESLKSMLFVQEEYSEIKKVILNGNIDLLKNFPETQPRTGEYLEIMAFKDQNESQYIVTVYDSNVLEQDPQVIEIYPL